MTYQRDKKENEMKGKERKEKKRKEKKRRKRKKTQSKSLPTHTRSTNKGRKWKSLEVNTALKITLHIYTMEYYSAIKNNEFMKFLGKWVELENIILGEVTQS